MKLFDNNIQFREMLRKRWKLTLENAYGSLLRRCEVQTWDWSGLVWIPISRRLETFINTTMDPQQLIWIQDPRSKITEKTSWIQGLDPRSKIPGKTSWIQDPRFQDSRKNFLDPRSGSKIQDPRFQKKLLGSKVWIQDPRFQEKLLGSTAEPGLGSGKALSSDPRSFFWNLGSWILDPDLASKKFFL